MIDSQLLSYLIVFSETGSLLKSSEILHLSQPSLSKAMQKLEAELDLTIFDRTGNKITLNDWGCQVTGWSAIRIYSYVAVVGETETLHQKRLAYVNEHNEP